jgi:radial spoke head protein 4A
MEGEGKELSQRELEIQNAKAKLIEGGTYATLAQVIRKLLDECPANAADQLSHIVDKVKIETTDKFNDNLYGEQLGVRFSEASQQAELAEKIQELFQSENNGEQDLEEDDESSTALPNLAETAFYFKQAGIGMAEEEWTRVYLAMKQLCVTEPTMEQCRFWGKIMGLKANYYIVEGKLPPCDDDYEIEEEQEKAEKNEETNQDENDDDIEGYPKSTWKPPVDVEPEKRGHQGTNMYTYWVTNEPGTDWTRLEPVKPAQISIARHIAKFFTGDLDANVVSFPVFPGQEKHLLRTQIARITHGAHVAPITYFNLDEDADLDNPEGHGIEEPQVNPEFEGVILRDLLDPSMQAWVHARPFILNQGRCDFKAQEKTDLEDEEFEDEEDTEVEELMMEADREIGPPQLSPLTEDTDVTGIPAWSVNTSNALNHPHHQIAIIKSNLWPGAAAYCNGHKFDNIYIGYGQKYNAVNYSPMVCQAFEMEFMSSEVIEESDPSVEQEKAKEAEEAAKQENEQEEDEDGTMHFKLGGQ